MAAVRVRGGLEEEIHVLIDEHKLIRSGLSISTVINRLRQENINVAGGMIKEGRAEYMVRTLNEYQNLAEIEDTVIIRREGREVRVKDLGRVVRSHKDRQIQTRTNGRESVQIDIYKEADANMVSVSDRIETVLGKIKDPSQKNKTRFFSFGPKKKREPMYQGLVDEIHQQEGAILEIVADRSKFVESSIREVRNTAIMGGLLAIVILFLFLKNIRSTLIIAVSIPMSLLMTFAPLNLMGVSLNIMSLGGLALGIGMLVDSSVVVLESIFRCREEGDGIKTAAIRGTSEVRSAVVASIVTSICVFFPMVFVEGIAGQAFGDLGTAVVISLSASLMVALFFIPMLASRTGVQWVGSNSGKGNRAGFQCLQHYRQSTNREHNPRFHWCVPYFMIRLVVHFLLELLARSLRLLVGALVGGIRKWILPVFRQTGRAIFTYPLLLTSWILDQIFGVYPRTIRWALRHPLTMFALVGLVFLGITELGKRLDTELLPEVHQGEFTLEVDLPVGTPLEETEKFFAPVEQAILANKEGIHSLLVTFGFDVTHVSRSDQGEHSARFKVILASNRNTAEAEKQVMDRLRTMFESIPDTHIRVTRPVLFSSKTPIVVEVHGDELERLKNLTDQVREIMSHQDELTDVETTLKSGAPEIQVVYNRDQIIRFGMNIREVAVQIRDMVKGFEATRFNMKDRRIPIVVQLEEKNRTQLEDIGRITINAGSERPVPLNSVATLTLGEGPSEIRRVDGRRIGMVEARMAGVSLGAAVEAVESELRKKITWPDDMTFFITGQNEEWERSKGSLYLALGLSIFLVYVIMAAQFESLIQPFVIMFTIPMAFIGTLIGLNLLGLSLSIVVILGMIMLAGIVVNNAIVLIDYVNKLRHRGLGLEEALVKAGTVRLRPILMTTSTTILGLFPMALGLGDGAEIRTPMAIAVIFGLITSTLLTLLIIPTAYYLTESFKERIFKPLPEEEDTPEVHFTKATP